MLNFPDLAHLGCRPPMKKRPYAILSPSASWVLLQVLYTEEENMTCLCLLLPAIVVPADSTVVLPGVTAAYRKNSKNSPHV